MRITLIDGAGSGPASDRIVAALGIRASHVNLHRLEEETIAPCRGCFECWTDHPGICTTRDQANAIVADMIDCDAVAFVTRPRFGAWDSRTKSVLDRSTGLVSPFFETIEGETRHKARYEHYPSWMVFAVGGGRAEERKLFRTLIHRNVVNLHARAPWIGFFDEDMPLARMDAAAGEALAALRTEGNQTFLPAPQRADWLGREGVPRREGETRHAVVWVGSAKEPGTSTSEALGRALADRLVERGWTMEVVSGAAVAKQPGHLLAAVERADLVIPASPVYVDALPALVLEGLAQLADHPSDERAYWLPIVQCGFPEVSHTVVALEILQHAVGERGDAWVGYLAMGEGEMLRGRPPEAGGRLTRSQCSALDDAAEAVDLGQPVSPETTAAFAHKPLPSAVYRAAESAGWLWRAFRSGASRRLDDRPYRR